MKLTKPMKPESRPATDIYFSQLTIGEKFTNGDFVCKWEDRSPYTNPILACEFGNSTITSYDNRRLYSWKQYNPSQDISCYIYEEGTMIEEENPLGYITGYMVWKDERVVESRKDSGVYLLQFRVNTYGGLIAFRCASQASNFPLHGRTELPQVCSNALSLIPFETSYYRYRKPKNDQSIPIAKNEALRLLETAQEIYIGRIFQKVHHHPVFLQFVKDRRESLAFISCVFIPNGSLILKGQGDKEEDWDEFDEESMSALLEIDDELEDEWIEYMKKQLLL